MNELRSIEPEWAWQPFVPTADRPWTKRLAAHLFRRAGFGANTSQLASAVEKTPTDVVVEMVAQNQEDTAFRASADTLAETLLASGNPKELSAAWVYRMLRTPNPLQEKLTLFWHGHFATSAEKVKDARMMWRQNQLLRKNALGNFAPLVQAISKDPAMLIYLDSTSNRKAHPNENYAREVMELFCLGEGHYSESDVQELARCFTGWEIKNDRFRKNRYQHDSGEKSILGHAGEFGGEDGVKIVLQQAAMPEFICRKLARFFICDEPELPAALIEPLAATMRENNLEISPVVSKILSSNLFFSEHSIGRKIKSPVEFIVGTIRTLEGSGNTRLIAEGLMQMGQGLFYPPSVKGWDGGRAWINSSTLLARANLIERFMSDESTKFGGGSLTDYVETCGINIPSKVFPWLCELTMATVPGEAIQKQLMQQFDFDERSRESSLRGLVEVLAALPAFHLA